MATASGAARRHGPRGARAAALLLAVVAAIGFGSDLSAQSSTRLQSFFISAPDDDGDRIVDVSQQGPDVRVRTVRVVLAHHECPGLVVRAHDAVVPNSTVAAVADAALCSLDDARVQRALDSSKRRYGAIDDFGWNGSIVATCDGAERRLAFERPAAFGFDLARLGRSDRAVLQAWQLLLRASDDAVGPSRPDRPEQETRETFGTTVVPDLVGGRYEAAFRDACWDGRRAVPCHPNYFAWRLEGYAGPPAERGPRPVELVDHASWQFSGYVAPVFPPIALAARLFGDVRLRLVVDRATGAVTAAEVVEGRPLLDASALTAARQWRFVAGTTPPEPFEVTLRFQHRCPGA